MRSKSFLAIAVFASATALSACAGVTDRRGFLPDETQTGEFQSGIDSKETVLSRMGNPSQTGTFDEQTWYYISSVQKQVSFYRPQTTERTIIAVSFDDGDKVAGVRRYGLADGRVINFDVRKTPTRGREVTFLEQIFGSIGRAPVQLPGTDPNLPTAAGGQRRR